MIVYGIPSCDTTQKALKWLDARNIAYTFHNYREHGITKEKLEAWLKKVPLNVLLNSRSTTFREFSEKEKAAAANPEKAIPLMIANTTVIKRPLLENGDAVLTGFKEAEWEQALKPGKAK